MKRAIVTYAAGAHEELLDVALPTYKEFASKHGYDLIIGEKICDLPPAWNKISLLMKAFKTYDEIVWLDCDLVIVDTSEDFPTLDNTKLHSLVRHFEDSSEIPNSGVWRLRKFNGLYSEDLLVDISSLEVFRNHGWWEQAALMTLMGYTVPPEGSDFKKTKCRNVVQTKWYNNCQFMRLCWNSHPNYRAEKPKIVHCSYQDMPRRLEVMRALVKDPNYDYPRYEVKVDKDEKKTTP